MKTERLQGNRIDEALKMSEYAFRYKVPADKWEEKIKETEDRHQVYGMIDEEALAAKLHLLPLEIYIGEQKFKMGGLAGVASYPEYRRKGYVKQLIKDSLYEMQKQGMTISMLHPFYVQFYRRFGYELFVDRKYYTLQRKDLTLKPEVPGSIKRVTTAYSKEMVDVYNRYAKLHNGMIARDKYWWEHGVYDEKDRMAVYYDEHQKAQGYMIYTHDKREMNLHEFVAVTANARFGLWNFLAQHDSMYEKVSLDLAPHDPLVFMLNDPRVENKTVPYFMARIVDLEGFFKLFAWKKDPAGLVLKVKDPVMEENNKTIGLYDREVKQIDEKPDIELSVNLLTSIILGYQTPSSLQAAGLITASEESAKRLEDCLPNRIPFFYDFF